MGWSAKLKSLVRGSFFAEPEFAAFGTTLANLNALVGRVLQSLAVFLWILILEAGVLWGQELKLPNMSHIVERPEIRLYPRYLNLDDLPSDVKTSSDFDSQLKPIFELIKEENYEKAYVDLARFMEARPNFAFFDWLSFLRADLLLQVHNRRESGNLSLALEEYELALRSYPLHPQVQRAVYQMALIKLYSGLYVEAEQFAKRGISEFPQSLLVPDYYLIDAEQAFLSGQFDVALNLFDLIVRKYPRSFAAVDSAFRKAFLHFTKGDFKAALATYRNLENFHSAEFNVLKMATEASSPVKLSDRLFYGESLFLTGEFSEASSVFQNLANLFPKHKNAAFVWIRYADTFYKRERYLAAQKLYEFVIENYSDNKAARALARVRLFSALKLTNRLRYDTEVEAQMRLAAKEADSAESMLVAEIAWSALADYFLEIQSYPKAQRILARLKTEFDETPNAKRSQEKYVGILEKEILDYYQSGDLLATLTTYLVHEEDVGVKFNNVQVLIRIADAAKELSLYEKAEEILNRVVYLESSSRARQEALLKLVDILILRKDLRKASERLRRFNFAYPTTALKYLYEKSWGDLYRAMDRPDRAVTHYEESLKLAKDVPGASIELRHTLIRLGEIYTKLDLPLKAIDSYSRYIQIYSDQDQIKLGGIPFTSRDQFALRLSRYRIADLYFNMRDYIQALGAYRTVSEEVSMEPFRSHSLYRIGECYLALNDREAALEAFRKVESKDPSNLWYRAAQSYIQSVEMEVQHGIRIFN